jgi:hypothetical protein
MVNPELKAFGQFSSSITQRPTALGPVKIILDSQEDTYGKEHPIDFNQGDVAIKQVGMYLIIAGLQISKLVGDKPRWIDFWIRVNNVDVRNSNVRAVLKDSALKDVIITQTVTRLNKGDTLNIMMAVEVADEGLGIEAIFLGILCNSLVCLAICLAASVKKVSDKILAIIFPISAFVAIGFEHSVANMYFLSFALMIKDDPMLLSAMKTAGITVDISNLGFIGVFNNLLPVTLGNIVGGSIFVGLIYWLAFLRNNKKES